jgi:glucose-1-phosphate thymidylyltransferase
MYWFRNIADLYVAIDEQMEKGIQLKNEYFLADAVQLMIDAGKRVETAPVEVWEDCGNVETLLSTNRYLLDRLQPEHFGVIDSVVISPSHIDPSAKIERSIVGPYASIGKNAVIADTIIRDTIVDDGAQVEFSLLERSLIGRDAAVKGRTVRLNVGDKSVIEK